MLGGIGPQAVLGLAREARSAAAPPSPLRVGGPAADALAAALAAGGERALVTHGGDPADASALVLTSAADPGPADLAWLRAGERHGVPIVAVRLDGTESPVPYVLATDVVAWPPGQAPPTEAVAQRLAARLGRDARDLAARLPALRPQVEQALVSQASLRAAAVALAPWGDEADLSLLSLMQSRLLLDLGVVRGGPPDPSPDRLALAVGPPLGLAVAAGLAARTTHRRAPRPLRRLASVVLAYGVTRALGTLAQRATSLS
jgi:hypothetical protein